MKTPTTAENKPAATQEEKPRVNLLFVGAIECEDGKLANKFQVVHKSGDGGWVLADDEPRLYTKLRSTMPGCVVSVCCNPENPSSVYPNTSKYEGQWHDNDDRVRWTAAWRATTDAFKQAKAAKEAMKENAAAERLEPFRLAYKKLNAEAKRQMLAEVLRYITT